MRDNSANKAQKSAGVTVLVIRRASIPLRILWRGINRITFDLQIVLIRQMCDVLSCFFLEGPEKQQRFSEMAPRLFSFFPKMKGKGRQFPLAMWLPVVATATSLHPL